MAKLVTKWRYLKPDAARHAQAYIRYIATREGVEKYVEENGARPAAQAQRAQRGGVRSGKGADKNPQKQEDAGGAGKQQQPEVPVHELRSDVVKRMAVNAAADKEFFDRG